MIEPTKAEIQILEGAEMRETLDRDLALPGNVYAWCYLFRKEFLYDLLTKTNVARKINFIVDCRQSAQAAELQDCLTQFNAWKWSYNRTMHDKTWIFPANSAIYIGSHNLNRGSFWTAINRSVRITSPLMTSKLMQTWNEDRQKAVKVQSHKDHKEAPPCE